MEALMLANASSSSVLELNVGGVIYCTNLTTLRSVPDSALAKMFDDNYNETIARDSKGRIFLDRDGILFRYTLDFLRLGQLILPTGFSERVRLRVEAQELGIEEMVKSLNRRQPGCISVGYRGTFAFGRDGLADVKFRKLSRILVSGKVNLCREVFQDTLNESRDPDRGSDDRYTARYFLKHNMLEQCFDSLLDAGFELVGSCGSGTNSLGIEVKPGQDTEENKWQHYNEFVFVRK